MTRYNSSGDDSWSRSGRTSYSMHFNAITPPSPQQSTGIKTRNLSRSTSDASAAKTKRTHTYGRTAHHHFICDAATATTTWRKTSVAYAHHRHYYASEGIY